MGKWLAASAKGLSYAAGPFKPLVDLVTKLYELELAEIADKKLQELIVEGNKDVIQEIQLLLEQIKSEEILQAVGYIKRQQTALASQLANGMAAIIELIEKQKIQVDSPEKLQQNLNENFIDANVNTFRENKFVCPRTIVEDCVKCWGTLDDIHNFLTIVESAGLDTSQLTSHSPFSIISQGIKQIFSPLCTEDKRTSIIGALAGKAKGSKVLKIAHHLLLLSISTTNKAQSDDHQNEQKKTYSAEDISETIEEQSYFVSNLLSTMRKRKRYKKIEHIKFISRRLREKQRQNKPRVCHNDKREKRLCKVQERTVALAKEVGNFDFDADLSLILVRLLQQIELWAKSVFQKSTIRTLDKYLLKGKIRELFGLLKIPPHKLSQPWPTTKDKKFFTDIIKQGQSILQRIVPDLDRLNVLPDFLKSLIEFTLGRRLHLSEDDIANYNLCENVLEIQGHSISIRTSIFGQLQSDFRLAHNDIYDAMADFTCPMDFNSPPPSPSNSGPSVPPALIKPVPSPPGKKQPSPQVRRDEN